MGERTKFLIKGMAQIGGIFKEISEETTAGSFAQAKRFIAWRLSNKGRMEVFLGDCEVYELFSYEQVKPKVKLKKSGKQLRLNF